MMTTPETDDRENTRSDRDEETSMWFRTPFGGGGARGRHITHLVYVTALFFIVLGYIWMHDQNTKDRAGVTQNAIAKGNEQVLAKIDKLTSAVTLNTCIASRNDVERKSEFESPNSYCNRTSK